MKCKICLIILSFLALGAASAQSDSFACDYATDIDRDGDGLIEICSLEGLNAIRYQADGTGYRASIDIAKITIGCPADGCKGYELTRDLDFLDDAGYRSTSNKVAWTVDDYEDSGDTGWQPIGNNTNPFRGIFEGNGHTVSNLKINRPNTRWVGLFGYINESAKIKNIGLLNVDIKGNLHVGGLVGQNHFSSVANSYATGSVSGNLRVGGLVGFSYFGSVANSYATGSVVGDSHSIGGLVGGSYFGSIANSYATGSVVGDLRVGGLVGSNKSSIANSYATGSVVGDQ